MSIPQIPEEKFRPNICEVLIDILKSIALEETAIARILNAEGEKNLFIIDKLYCEESENVIDEFNKCIYQSERILNTILMKEWLLLKKIETVLELKDKFFECEEECCEFEHHKKCCKFEHHKKSCEFELHKKCKEKKHCSDLYNKNHDQKVYRLYSGHLSR